MSLEAKIKKVKVLVFLEHYLPGNKSGGPVQTIKNIINNLGEEVEFHVLTLDRDLGDSSAYPNIQTMTWVKAGKAHVYYVPPSKMTFGLIMSMVGDKNYDVIYLNSFFSLKFSILPALACLFKKRGGDLLIAPRGEFSPGACSIKKKRKSLFIFMSRLFSIYKNALFHASNEEEKVFIKEKLGRGANVKVANDLPDPIIPSGSETASFGTGLRVCFISRIVPIKNLDYAIKVLAKCKANIVFDIYGTKEDDVYWRDCQKLLDGLPANISWNYQGVLELDEVKAAFGRYDVFLFPTKGENYGHVIAEALLAGAFVLISDQAPWGGIEALELGRVIPLRHPERFVDALEKRAQMTQVERQKTKSENREKALSLVIRKEDIDQNRDLFNWFVHRK